MLNTSLPGVRRRHRAVQSCFSCRSRKLKCDKQRPCRTCQGAGRDCTADAPSRAAVNHGHRHPEKGTVRSAQQRLEIPPEELPPASSSLLVTNDGFVETFCTDKSFEIDKVSYADAVYEEAKGECPLDLGVQLGRMRIMERLGGYHQPRLIQQIGAALRAVQRRNKIKLPDEAATVTSIQTNVATPSYLQPCPDYIAPSSGFFFCSDLHPLQNNFNFLNLDICRTLLSRYWGTAHILSKCLHRPSFEKQWDAFWTCIARNLEPPPAIEAVVMAVLLSGTIATPELALTNSFGTRKSTLIDSFKAATESALVRAKFVHTTELETLQALVIYLIAICRAQLSKDHIALLGVTIGIAETMGLHRDPTLYNFDVIETHARRLLWHQLCFLDLRACEAHRPRPQIREDEFDAMIPPAVNDKDVNKTVDDGIWTDSSFSIMNFECSVIHRVIWLARPRLERKEVDIPTVLGSVMDFRTRMLYKYAFLRDDIPIQKYTKFILEVLIAKLFSMVLHRYHRAINSKLPERIHHLLFDQIILQLTNVLALETLPELNPWAWHVNAWNHYRTAIILLEEVSVHPHMPKADKIWRILDYVFLQPPGLTPDEKSIAILSDAKERLCVYSRLKKMKVPGNLGPRIDQDTELPQISNSQSYHTTCVAPAGIDRPLNDTPPLMSATAALGSTDIDFLGGSQYSPYTNLETIEDIDWTLWDYMPSNDFNSITDA